MTTLPTALRATRLTKQFGELRAVDGVSLELPRGECLGLLGPNGAGKTTTVEMLEGLTAPDTGEIEMLGAVVFKDGISRHDAVRPRIGVQLQQTELSDKLTVRETVSLFRSFYPRGRSVDGLLELLSLVEKQHAGVGTLSGGQKQRLALACALAGDPEILFLDEPTTGLDPQARLKVWEVIETFRAAGGSVLVTTHYMEEAARLCGRVAIMDHGHIIAVDTPERLIASLGAEQIVELEMPEGSDGSFLSRVAGVSAVRRKGHTWSVTAGSLREVLPALLEAAARSSVIVESVTTHRATLEDVFVALTGRDLRDG